MNKIINALFTVALITLGSLRAENVLEHTEAKLHPAITTKLQKQQMSAQQLRNAMSKLWYEHGIWTHEYIVAFLQGLPKNSPKLTLDRLMRNQDDIGNAVALFYGKEAGAELTKLLKEHIALAGDVLKHAKAGNDAELKKSDAQWHKNADEISEFLHNANKENWSYKVIQSMMYEHLKLTKQEAVAWLKQDWAQEIKLYDTVLEQLQHMGKALSDGIIKAFDLR